MVIAIDGPSGSGKTSIAKSLAKKIGFYYCDSGSLYRAITHFFLKENINVDDNKFIESALEDIDLVYDIESNNIYLNNINITTKLRSVEITNHVSVISSIKAVREKMSKIQHKIAKDNNIIVDGRDIGTCVFPDAQHKFFLDADVEVRAKRRFDEINQSKYTYEEILEKMSERDRIDRSRKHSPLVRAKDAIYINNTNLSLDKQVGEIIKIINN